MGSYRVSMDWNLAIILIVFLLIAGSAVALWWWRMAAKIAPYEDELEQHGKRPGDGEPPVVVIDGDGKSKKSG